MTPFKPEVTYKYLVEMNRRYKWNTEIFIVGKKIPSILRKKGLKINLLDISDFARAQELNKSKTGKELYEIDPDECCRLLKVTPTQKAVENLDAWVAGLRKDEGRTRVNYQYVEKKGNLVKINPILDWTEIDIWRYLAINEIPVNPMYRLGYRSLGCEPCTG